MNLLALWKGTWQNLNLPKTQLNPEEISQLCVFPELKEGMAF